MFYYIPFIQVILLLPFVVSLFIYIITGWKFVAQLEIPVVSVLSLFIELPIGLLILSGYSYDLYHH